MFLGLALPTITAPSAIAWHVPLDIKEKIQKGEYYNVFNLINAGVKPGKSREGKEDEGAPRRAWVEWSLGNW